MNEELAQLCEADQADRRGSISSDLGKRDGVRRKRATELIESGALQDGDDYYHAALIFQHGSEFANYWHAHELALKAAELGHRGGRWLAAAAYDRWLMKQGKPQKYGTQYVGSSDGTYHLWDVDPETTDEERAQWSVPPLAKALQRAEEITERHRNRSQ